MPSPLKKSFSAELKKPQKGISSNLIAVIAVVGIIVVICGYVLFSRYQVKVEPASVTEEKPSIAVLPFDDLSPEQDQEWFSDGIHENILTHLSSISDLNVISRGSVIRYKDTDKSNPQIAKELGATTILEGTVFRFEDRVRITAQLIDAKTDYHIWSDTYESEIQDIFEIQSDIARQIASALRVELTDSEKDRIEKKPTENLEAYELYLLGRHNWKRMTEEDNNQALEYYNRALATDSDLALAYSGIADVYSRMAHTAGRDPLEFYPKAKDAARKALEIDDTIAEAHTSLAWINLNYEWDWDTAGRGFERAIELNPGYFQAHWWYCDYLEITRQFHKALLEIERCKELNPQMSAYVRRKSQILINLGRYDEAIAVIDKAYEENPDFTNYYTVGLYLSRGKYRDKAIEAFQKLNRDEDEEKIMLAFFYGAIGEKGKAEQIISEYIELKQERYVPSLWIAWLYAEIDETDKVFEWLEKAYKEHDSFLPYINFMYAFENLRPDPRFKALLKKIGLPE